MSLIADIQKALEMWPAWKRLSGLPDRVDALEKRLAELEGKPLKAPGAACPACGALDFRVTASRRTTGAFARMGLMDRDYLCGACGFAETREKQEP